MTMQIMNYSDSFKNQNHIGEFDLYFPSWEMTLHKLKVVRSKKGHLFISFPSWCEKFEDGTKKFHPYISLSQKKNEGFQKAVLELLKDYIPIAQQN